ncbi:MerC domain-containing protein [Granulicella paludicola]|uniref:MerC domain-containing protein n=1 Tax=Granulicella paludicola TaxID=474951 RepID=UPI0021E09949|nr:MerC domain-containing protein [Granulicella paludicola]
MRMQLQEESLVRAGWSDRLGIWASGLCVVHCVLTPVLLSMSAVLAHLLPSEEGTHRTLALLVSLLGCLALVKGFRAHGRRLIPCLMAAGLACIFFGAFAGDHLAAHWEEVAITCAGSALMIAAHRLNHTFCRRCSCASC